GNEERTAPSSNQYSYLAEDRGKVCLMKRKVYIFIKFAKIIEGKRKPRDKPPEHDLKMQTLLPFSTLFLLNFA
ncbi:hypothetical protein E2320_009814, partial [Naja naja]